CCITPANSDTEGLPGLDDDEDTVQAFTRDGESVTLLPLLWSNEGARALGADTAAPVWHLDPSRDDAWRLAGELIDQTLSLPAHPKAQVTGEVSGRDRESWTVWRRRFETFAEESSLGKRVVPVPFRAAESGGFEGAVRLWGKRKRVTYTNELGLVLESEER